MSHTQFDKEFCDRFDTHALARIAGISGFRSEFEKISSPAWKTIKAQMNESSVMFLMVGKELVKMQEQSSRDSEIARRWKYTQNWIAFEIGLMCQRGKDVWVLCDNNVAINFPVPYFNHYAPFAGDMDWLRQILEIYVKERCLPLDPKSPRERCPNNQCQIQFTFWGYQTVPVELLCPQCLQTTVIEWRQK